MKTIEKFIYENLDKFEKLECSEVLCYALESFSNDIVEFLKDNYRYDFAGICIHYVDSNDDEFIDNDEIWVENLNA
jgi:hypothetical protein